MPLLIANDIANTRIIYIKFRVRNKTKKRNDEKYSPTGIPVKIHINHDGVRATVIMVVVVRSFTSVQLRFSSFFFWLFLPRMRGNLLIYRKMSISRLLWGDRWKLHGEIQRHAIVTTYMFMTNDRCEDSFM